MKLFTIEETLSKKQFWSKFLTTAGIYWLAVTVLNVPFLVLLSVGDSSFIASLVFIPTMCVQITVAYLFYKIFICRLNNTNHKNITLFLLVLPALLIFILTPVAILLPLMYEGSYNFFSSRLPLSFREVAPLVILTLPALVSGLLPSKFN
jgi:hypothetical protein